MGCCGSTPVAEPQQFERPKGTPPGPPSGAKPVVPDLPPAAPVSSPTHTHTHTHTQGSTDAAAAAGVPAPTAAPAVVSPTAGTTSPAPEEPIVPDGSTRGPRRASVDAHTHTLTHTAPADAAAPAPPGLAALTPASGAPPPTDEVITGVLWKRGEAGTGGAGGWKQRFVVLARNSFQYYTSSAAYEAGKPPVKNVTVRLNEYAVLRGPHGGSKASAATDKLVASTFHLLPLKTSSSTRVWELRSVEVQDAEDWLASFVEMGCTSQAAYEAGLAAPAPAPAAPAAGTDAPAAPAAGTSETAAPPAPVAAAAPDAEADRQAKLNKAAAEAKSKKDVFRTKSSRDTPGTSGGMASDAAAARAAEAEAIAATVAAAVTNNLGEDDDPATDANDPVFKSGLLKKKGEEGTFGGSNFKPRWVVLKGGVMTYWHSEAERSKKGAKPIKENRVHLSEFTLTVDESSNVVKLQPLPGTDAAKHGKGDQGRVWELQVPGTVRDLNAWVDALMAQGIRRAMPKSNRPASTSETAAPAPAPDAAPAPAPYNWRATGEWEECVSPDNGTYYFHVPTGASQWEEPTGPIAPPAGSAAVSAPVPAAVDAPAAAAAPVPETGVQGAASLAEADDPVVKVGALTRKGKFSKAMKFYELRKSGKLTEYANEAAYVKGGLASTNATINVNVYSVDSADAGATSLSLIPKAKGQPMWELIAANAEERAAWAAVLATSA